MIITQKIFSFFAKFFLFTLIFCSISLAKSSAKTKMSDLESILRSKYSNLKTLRAKFVQKQKNPILNSTRESSGVLYIETPAKFRWETLNPERSILLTTPEKTIYYVPPPRDDQRGQVAYRKSNDVSSQVALDLLSGGKNIAKNFSIKTLDRSHYELKPLKSLVDIKVLELFLEKSTNLVYKIVLNFKSGKSTEIVLQEIEWNATLDEKIFSFKVPSNTDVMN